MSTAAQEPDQIPKKIIPLEFDGGCSNEAIQGEMQVLQRQKSNSPSLPWMMASHFSITGYTPTDPLDYELINVIFRVWDPGTSATVVASHAFEPFTPNPTFKLSPRTNVPANCPRVLNVSWWLSVLNRKNQLKYLLKVDGKWDIVDVQNSAIECLKMRDE